MRTVGPESDLFPPISRRTREERGSRFNMMSSLNERKRLRQMDGEALASFQVAKFNELLRRILPHNRFYATKLASARKPIDCLTDLQDFPYTTKDELVESKSGGFAANLTYPFEQYVRLHRTSGTRGRPMMVLDTEEDWQWWVWSWQFVLDAAEIGPEDRVAMAFSFGPFIGFWSAFDAVVARGSLVAPTGGMNSLARLDLIRTMRATAIMCTPSYALHLSEVAEENHMDVASWGVHRVIVAGEPGGSIPAIQKRIENAWNARVIDHAGASESGAWGFANSDGTGLVVNESEFIAEFRSLETGAPAGEGELSELILTTLGRFGSPVIRYRTGDLVKPTWNSQGDCRFVELLGGVLGRTDDMLIVRGVNIFPTSVEQILRSFPEVVEYRMTATKMGVLDNLVIEIEDRLNDPERVAKELQLRLGLRVDVEVVPAGTLPRFEGKGKRFVDKRSKS